MANKKFSEFTTRTDSANVDFLVGYDGSTNVKIAPSNVGGGGGEEVHNIHSNFNHSSNSAGSYYYIPLNSQTEGRFPANYTSFGAIGDGYIRKVMFVLVSGSGIATSTTFRVQVGGSVVHTGAAITHGTTDGTFFSDTFASTDAPFSEGDELSVQFLSNGTLSAVNAIIEYVIT